MSIFLFLGFGAVREVQAVDYGGGFLEAF